MDLENNMTKLLNKVRHIVEEGLDNARQNARTIKDIADDYSKTTRLKFEIHQLRSALKKKIYLLGETVLPYLAENNLNGLKKHETLPVLIDNIKNLQNEIGLAEKNLQELGEEEQKAVQPNELKEQIKELEKEIEIKISKLKDVKKALKK